MVSGGNSIPTNYWRNSRTGIINSSDVLWNYLRVSRDHDDTWELSECDPFGSSGSTARWILDNDTITIHGGIAFNPSGRTWLDNSFASLNSAQREAVSTINITGNVNITTNLPQWEVSMRRAFAGLPNLEAINGIERINTSGVMTMEGMFSGASSLTELDISDWYTGAVRNMQSMFDGASS